MLDMKRIRDPLFPQRRMAQTMIGRSAITGIMDMNMATPISVNPPVMLPTEPAMPVEMTPEVPETPTLPPVSVPETPVAPEPETPTTPAQPEPEPEPEPEIPVTPQPTEPATPTTPTPTQPVEPVPPVTPEPTTPVTPPVTPEPVTPAPTITTQPTAVRVVQGESFTLTVAASDANTYKWQRLVSGVWTDISGARSKTYTITAAASTDAGEYRAIAAGTGGQTPSAAVAVKVDTAFIAIGKQTLLGVDIGSAPFGKVTNGRQTFTLTLKGGQVSVKVAKFPTGLLGTLLGSVLTPLTGGIDTLRWTLDDPTIVTVTAGATGSLNIKPLKTGKTVLRLYADASGLTADGAGVVEITVT